MPEDVVRNGFDGEVTLSGGQATLRITIFPTKGSSSIFDHQRKSANKSATYVSSVATHEKQ